MTEIWAQAALWLALALVASLLSIWFRVATALSEIVVGTIAQLFIGALLGSAILAGDATWIKFLSGAGAILLTFLAGAELDPVVFRKQWKQATAIGLVSFAGPFFGCAALARWGLGWSVDASWLAGIAMSTTSVAVVYAVMLEFGLNVTDYGKTVLAACFITDLATVVALCPLYRKDDNLYRCRRSCVLHLTLGSTSLFQTLWWSTFGTRSKVSSCLPVRNGRISNLG